jgi:hypothetical protein
VYIIDFFLGFFKSYLDDRTGREIRDKKTISIKYLKFYFWFDLVSILPVNIVSDNSYLRCLELIKIVRLNRLN